MIIASYMKLCHELRGHDLKLYQQHTGNRLNTRKHFFLQKVIDAWNQLNLPDNLPDKASPGETGSASRVTQTEIVYKVTHLYNVFPIAA